MKTIVPMTVTAGLLFAAATGPLSLAQTASSPPAAPGQGSADSGVILRGHDVLDEKLFSQQGEELGHIRDFLLDPKTGTISHAVVGMGGWQGFGERYAVIPWQMIRPDEQKAGNYILQADREKFRTAPTFERDQWATVLQPGYLTKVQEHFSAPTAPGPQAQPQQQSPQQAPAPPSPPDVTGEQKKQAQERPRKEGKEGQQAQQKESKPPKSRGTVGTDDDSK